MTQALPLPLKSLLDELYQTYNQRRFVDPDPLIFLYQYPDIRDREIVGLVAALLAYGRVAQIMKSVEKILYCMGPHPYKYLLDRCVEGIKNDFKGFRHRFASEDHMASLLIGVKSVIHQFGSLQNCFVQGFSGGDKTVLPALEFFVRHLTSEGNTGHLVAHPEKKSACKRNHLFLRWMVRKDAVDPGGWECIPASALLVPLDTHMHTAGTLLGFTKRKQADITAVLEITKGFQQLCPEDPVKYDFCLTRFGIRKEMTVQALKIIIDQQPGLPGTLRNT